MNSASTSRIRSYGYCSNAAFIKELMRRSVQFHLERNGTGRIELPDVEQALDEMLFSGGSLNVTLLGGTGSLSPAAK